LNMLFKRISSMSFCSMRLAYWTVAFPLPRVTTNSEETGLGQPSPEWPKRG